jgi:hypothetical protein
MQLMVQTVMLVEKAAMQMMTQQQQRLLHSSRMSTDQDL